MRPERRCKSGMDGGLAAASLVSPPHHLRTADFLSKRWGPPHIASPRLKSAYASAPVENPIGRILKHSIILSKDFQFAPRIKEKVEEPISKRVAQFARLLVQGVGIGVLFRQFF